MSEIVLVIVALVMAAAAFRLGYRRGREDAEYRELEY